MQIMYVVLSKFALYPSNYILSVLTCLHSIHSGSKTHITSLKQNNKIAYFFHHLSQPQVTALFMFLSWFLSLPAVWQLHCLHGRGLRKWHRVQPREGGGGRLAPFVRIPGQLWFRYTAVCLSSFLLACLPAPLGTSPWVCHSSLPVCPLGHFALSLSQQSACLPPRHFALSLSQQSACLPSRALCLESVAAVSPVCPLGHFALSLSQQCAGTLPSVCHSSVRALCLESVTAVCLPPQALCLESVTAVCLSALSGTLPWVCHSSLPVPLGHFALSLSQQSACLPSRALCLESVTAVCLSAPSGTLPSVCHSSLPTLSGTLPFAVCHSSLPVCPLGHFAISLSQQSACPLRHFAMSLSQQSACLPFRALCLESVTAVCLSAPSGTLPSVCHVTAADTVT